MTGSEKILAIIIAILLMLVIFFGYQYSQNDNLFEEGKRELNKIHERNIASYKEKQDSLFKTIRTLQRENDSLNHVKQRIKVVTIQEIDSVQRLPFRGKAKFWAVEVARIDSIKRGYLSDDN